MGTEITVKNNLSLRIINQEGSPPRAELEFKNRSDCFCFLYDQLDNLLMCEDSGRVVLKIVASSWNAL